MSQVPPYPPQNPYEAPEHGFLSPHRLQEAPGGTGSLVLGILSILFTVPVLGLIMPLIGLHMARNAKSIIDTNPAAFTNGGVVQAALVCNIVGLVLNGLATVCGCAYLSFIFLVIGGSMA